MTNVLHGLSDRLAKVPAAYANEAAATVQESAERFGGTMMGRYKLTIAEAKRYVYDGGCTLILYGTPAGFWVWKETGTAAHEIRAKGRRKAKRKANPRGHGATRGHAPTYTGRPAKRRKKAAAKMPGRLHLGSSGGHPITGSVRHPGTAGKQAWTKAMADARPKLDAGLALVLAQAAD